MLHIESKKKSIIKKSIYTYLVCTETIMKIKALHLEKKNLSVDDVIQRENNLCVYSQDCTADYSAYPRKTFRKGKYRNTYKEREAQTITEATGNRHVELEEHKDWKTIVLEVNLTLTTEYSSGQDGRRSRSGQEPPEITDMFQLACYWVKFWFSAGRARLRGPAARAQR